MSGAASESSCFSKTEWLMISATVLGLAIWLIGAILLDKYTARTDTSRDTVKNVEIHEVPPSQGI
jgi:NO-binding membrane sensor protein with MHYT domain